MRCMAARWRSCGGLETPQRSDNGDALVRKIEEDQQAVFEILRSGEVGSLRVPQEKVQKAGQYVTPPFDFP